MKKNFLKASTLALSLLLLAACGGEKQTAEDQAEEIYEKHLEHDQISKEKQEQIVEPTKEIPNFEQPAPALQSQVNNLLGDYLNLKQALVESSAEGTAEAANQLLNNIKEFDGKDLPAEQKNFYQKKTSAMQDDLRYMTQTKELERQRDHFALLTRYTYELTKAFDANQEPVYYQYCPMAFDNNGGYWLSAQEEIRNPYFGDKMLKCGRVEETIQN